MSTFTTTAKALTIAALLGMPAAAQAAERSASFTVKATVPVSCWVRPDAQMLVSEGGAGSVTEACNNPGGFTVTAVHRELAVHERATMAYGQSLFNLAHAPSSLVSTSDKATIRQVGYRFLDVTLDTPLVVALTIQPI